LPEPLTVETVRAIARLFKTDKVFIIGSQSILLSWPQAPVVLRTSGEIDAYPANARLWEIEHKKLDPDCEASEEISTLFGEGSDFHQQHGFYIALKFQPAGRRAVFSSTPSTKGQ
jgi:hypothetical protein